MAIRVVTCEPGDLYYPWNYGEARFEGDGLVSREPAPAGRGEVTLDAIDDAGEVVGSARVMMAARNLSRVITCDEYAYGGVGTGSSGPFLWPDNDEPWIVLLRGIWVAPEQRRRGIARLFVEHVRRYELPTWVAFANSDMRAWFERDLRPGQLSPLQVELDHAMRAAPPDDPSAFVDYALQAEIAVERAALISNVEGLYDDLDLDDLILDPPRADEDDLDGGAGEEELTDTAVAADRSYGYDVYPDTVTVTDDHPPVDTYRDLEDDAIDRQVIGLSVTGSVEVWDPRAVLAYATLRRLLRTATMWTPSSVSDALHELFVADFDPLPEHAVSYNATIAAHAEPPAR